MGLKCIGCLTGLKEGALETICIEVTHVLQIVLAPGMDIDIWVFGKPPLSDEGLVAALDFYLDHTSTILSFKDTAT